LPDSKSAQKNGLENILLKTLGPKPTIVGNVSGPLQKLIKVM
jgi:hypothetical protein